jgi:hypothetical protein
MPQEEALMSIMLLQATAYAAPDQPVCAGHGTELARWKSSRQVFAEPKARKRARASS